jgi:hypothetical protein
MSAERKTQMRHAREITTERNKLLAAVRRLSAELRRIDGSSVRANVDETEVEACEELVAWAERRARERAKDRRFFAGVA